MNLNLFSLSGLILSFTCFMLVAIVLLYGRTRLHWVWSLFNSSVGLWGIGAFLIGQAKDASRAIFVWRLAHIGVIFIAVFLFHVTYILCGLRKKKLLIFAYAQGIAFLALNFINHLFIKDVRFVFSSFYYSVPGVSYPIFIIIWVSLVFYAHYEMFLFYRKSKGIVRNQISYFFLGTVLAFLGGIANFLPAFRIDIYPTANFAIPLYCITVTYAIFKYRLMDIKVAITSAGIFLLVYALVLGVPFYIGWLTQQWFLSTSLAVALATSGPIIYRLLKKKTSDLILHKQRHYQYILMQAAKGMVAVHNVDKLAKLIVYILKKTVKISFVAIFLNEKEKKFYKLKVIRYKERVDGGLNLSYDNPFILYLKDKEDPFFYEEVPQAVKAAFNFPLEINLVIPSFIEEDILGFVILGEKVEQEPYSDDDIRVFKILAHQAALAISYSLFLDDFRKTQEQIANADKMSLIGGMADGVAHQIKNRLNHFSIASGELQFEIKDFIRDHPQLLEQNPDLVKSFDYLNHIASTLIENVKRTDGIIKGMINFAIVEQRDTFFSQFSLKEIIDLSLDLLRVKHEISYVPLEISLDASGDILFGVKAQIMEAVFNLIDNCYEAMEEKRKYFLNGEEKKNYVQLTRLKLTQKEDSSFIEISDNGIGIKEEDKSKVFAPFFTTKSSYKSGMGIGMYIVKRMVEENHKGRIWFESEYAKGTTFYIELPRK